MNGTTEFQYDALDRLVKMSKSVAETHYGYDALGRRIWKERGGSRREFLWDGDVLLQETGGDTSNREYLYYPDCFEPLAILDRTAFYIVGTDAAGAVREVHGESGDVVWKAFYHAKGGVESEATADIENPLRLLGQYFDVESGLHYNRNRYYDPQLGAFTSQDPWFCGEDAYSYGPNVWSWSDPLGLVCPRLARRLAARIRRMQRNMTPFERSRTTFAAAEVRLPNGRREVWVAAAGQRGYVPPRIRGRADRMIVAPARPQHAHLPHVNDAERALLRAARREGATIDGIRATRPMCDHCQDALNRGGASGGVIPD
jgi:RHS repeat-associated protein